MARKRSTLALAAGAAALAAAAAVVGVRTLTEPSAPAPVSAEGPRAPELAGTDPVTGEEVRLSDFAGRPVVVNVWATWCPGCVAEADDLRRFAEAHPEAVVLGINLQDEREAARRFYDEWGWQHPSISDPDGRLAGSLGLVGMPTTYFLSPEHRLVTTIVGETDVEGFEEGLAQATGRS